MYTAISTATHSSKFDNKFAHDMMVAGLITDSDKTSVQNLKIICISHTRFKLSMICYTVIIISCCGIRSCIQVCIQGLDKIM